MADEIKQKIVLEGEKEYSAALKEANRNLKTLRSELKAETAELGNNASAQQKNETKARNLRKQIEQQEKVVETLKAALKEAKERYGDNAEETAKWEQKLNAARYTLATMNNQLDAATEAIKEQQDALRESAEGYDDAANAAGDYADAIGSAEQTANAVTFSGVIQAADGLTAKLKDAIGFIIELGKSAWEWMGDSGEWADTLTTDATKWGIDRETLQGWRYAARFVDTEVETIAKAFTKLTNRSDSTNKKLKEIGIVADKGVKGQDLFWEVVDAMNGMEEAARENTAMDIFGKSYQELLPLINAGREAWEGYVQEARDAGYILSDEQVDNLGKFDDATQKLNASFEAMQHTVAAELAPAFTSVADGLSKLIDSFTEWSKTESGQKTLQDLGEAIKGIADQIVGERNFEGIVRGAADGVKALTGALQWIKDNWGTVETGIKGIGVAFGGLTVGSDVLKALLLIKGIKWLGGGGAAAGAAGASGAGTAVAAGGGFAGLIAKGKNALSGMLSQITPFAMQNGAIVADWFTNSTNAGRAMRDGGDILAGAQQDIAEIKEEISNNSASFADDWTALGDELRRAVFGPDVDMNTGEAQAALGFRFTPEQIAAAQGYWDAYRNGEDGGDTLENLLNAIPNEDVLNALMDKIEQLAGINDTIEDLPDAWFSDVLDALTWESTGDSETTDAVNGLQALPKDVGDAAYAGIVNGISGLQITLDGYTVGTLVAPFVSAQIARNME